GAVDVQGICFPAGDAVRRWKVRRLRARLRTVSGRAPERGYRGGGRCPCRGNPPVRGRGGLGPFAPAGRASRNTTLTGERGRGSPPLVRLRGLLPPRGFLGIHGLIRSLHQVIE